MALFNPPLSLQRQEWLLSVLSSIQANSILEIGCAEAPLTLCIATVPPAPFVPSPDWLNDMLRKKFPDSSGAYTGPSQVAPADIIAMDLDEAVLRRPIRLLEQQAPEVEPRFRAMRVRILQGSLAQFDSRLRGLDAIVAAEVIEHLDEPTLEAFGRVVLGTYRPKKLLVTTPNYAFNCNFPGADTQQGFYKDITGRTDRWFRHDDHRFEFTPSEFRAWCDALAAKEGYDVEVGGISICSWKKQQQEHKSGSQDEKDAKYASQTALFTRCHSDKEPVDEEEGEHHTLKTLFDRTLACTSDPEPALAAKICQLTVIAMEHAQLSGDRVTSSSVAAAADCWTVWMDRAVRVSCAGRLDVWFEALDKLRRDGEADISGAAMQFELIQRGASLLLCIISAEHPPAGMIQKEKEENCSTKRPRSPAHTSWS